MIPLSAAAKIELLTSLSKETIKTGKRGRPRKLLTKKDLRKLFLALK